jgi:hypothetical protein
VCEDFFNRPESRLQRSKQTLMSSSAFSFVKVAIAKRIAVVILPFLCFGCTTNRVSPNSIEGRMGAAISRNCGSSQTCKMQLRELTPFKWDRMFYFDVALSPSERQRAVGVSIPAHELQRQIVFLNHDKVIYNELLPTDFEKPVRNEVLFEIVAPATYFTCDDSAVFLAKHEGVGTGTPFYSLGLTK